jgi:transcriptional regulator with PAS, ATPase and Fis domain
MVCESPEMQEVVKRVRRFSSTDSTLLVLGETGTGKELLAHSIHNLSNRSKQPFVSINCAALSEELLQSELFGYEEGAFTGSKKGGKPGLFELAHNGTIFLDEINATSQNVQRHLLRVLQEKEVMRVGADRITPINVRIIAASNTELIEEVNAGRFREDLFFRINVLNLRIPPLRDRIDDLPLLAEKFIGELCRRYKKKQLVIPETNMQSLKSHNWPGNIRQLQNFLERLILIVDNEFESVVFDELFDELFEYQARPAQLQTKTISSRSPLPAPETAGRTEQEIIQQALASTGYHKTKTAEKLGISRTTLWKKMKKYGM